MADDNGASLVRTGFDGEFALALGLDIVLVTRGLKKFNVRFGLDGDCVGGGSLSKLPLVVMLQLVLFLFEVVLFLFVIDVETISSLSSAMSPPSKHPASRNRELLLFGSFLPLSTPYTDTAATLSFVDKTRSSLVAPSVDLRVFNFARLTILVVVGRRSVPCDNEAFSSDVEQEPVYYATNVL